MILNHPPICAMCGHVPPGVPVGTKGGKETDRHLIEPCVSQASVTCLEVAGLVPRGNERQG